MNAIEYFTFISASPWYKTLIILLLATLTIAGILAHLPIAFPGPLTVTERAHARVRGLLGWALSFFPVFMAFVAFVLTLLLLAPPRKPIDVLLFSRTRPVAAQVNLTSTTQSRPHVDLGLLVSQTLDICRRNGASSWVTGTTGERNAARKALLEVIGADNWAVATSAPVSVRQEIDLPPWLVRSVEYSAVALATRRFNVVEVKVAPGYERAEEWPLAATILSYQKVQVELVDPLQMSPLNPQVQRIVGATLTGKVINAWAVISGRINAPYAPKMQLISRITREPIVFFTLDSIAPDSAHSRVVQFRHELGAELSRESEFIVADVSGVAQCPLRHVGSTRQAPHLQIAGTSAEQWANVLRRASTDMQFEGLRKELQEYATDLPVPGSNQDSPVLLIRENCAILARTTSIAEYALTTMQFDQSNMNGQSGHKYARITSALDGPASVFSWLALPVKALGSRENTGMPVVLLDCLEQNQLVTRPLLSAGGRGTGRFVLFMADATKPPSPADPFRSAALAKSLAWATRYVSDESFSEGLYAASTSPLSEDPPSGPVLSEADLDRVTAKGLTTLDWVAVAVVGFYLTTLLGRVTFTLLFQESGSHLTEGKHHGST